MHRAARSELWLALLGERHVQAGRVRASILAGTQRLSRPLLSLLPSREGQCLRAAGRLLSERAAGRACGCEFGSKADSLAHEAGSRLGAHPHTDLDGLWKDQWARGQRVGVDGGEEDAWHLQPGELLS